MMMIFVVVVAMAVVVDVVKGCDVVNVFVVIFLVLNICAVLVADFVVVIQIMLVSWLVG